MKASSFHSAAAEMTVSNTETCVLPDSAAKRCRLRRQHRTMPVKHRIVPTMRTTVTASISSPRFPDGHSRNLVFRFLRDGIDVVGHDTIDQQAHVVERGEQDAAPRPIRDAG